MGAPVGNLTDLVRTVRIQSEAIEQVLNERERSSKVVFEMLERVVRCLYSAQHPGRAVENAYLSISKKEHMIAMAVDSSNADKVNIYWKDIISQGVAHKLATITLSTEKYLLHPLNAFVAPPYVAVDTITVLGLLGLRQEF